MTPNVRCSVPNGLTAVSGIPSGFSGVCCVIDERKAEREDWSWGRDEGVMRGMQRKWVNFGTGGLGGIFVLGRL